MGAGRARVPTLKVEGQSIPKNNEYIVSQRSKYSNKTIIYSALNSSCKLVGHSFKIGTLLYSRASSLEMYSNKLNFAQSVGQKITRDRSLF